MVECNKTVMDAIDLAMDAERTASRFYAEDAKKSAGSKVNRCFCSCASLSWGIMPSWMN
jgi:rubrerythrin